MKLDFAIRSVAPKELAEITGLSPAMQRDWRRAGHLPRGDGGWTFFDLAEVVEIATKKSLTDVGLGPLVSKRIFEGDAGKGVIRSLMTWVIEADSWSLPNHRERPGTTRLEIAASMAEADLSNVGRLLIFDLTTGEVGVQNDGLSVDNPATGPIKLVIELDTLGQQVASRASQPFVRMLEDAS